MRKRWGYGAPISQFLEEDPDSIFGALARWSGFADEPSQKAAWLEQISILKGLLHPYAVSVGALFFEYDIPRLGRRADTILVLEHVLFVIEFKVGANTFSSDAIDQVWDYALDLKNFHDASHHIPIVPVLVATKASGVLPCITAGPHEDDVVMPITCGALGLADAIQMGLEHFPRKSIDPVVWQDGHYHPTPTIVEAARALYAGHSVKEISRNDAGAENLSVTSNRLSHLIAEVRERREKAIFFVTGVPGAGKTLVGLDIANRHNDEDDSLYSVYLSGNGPLVSVLHEALARDQVVRARTMKKTLRIGQARSAVKQFIQNVHHFRDDCLASAEAPIEHIALFDEAQRAWDLHQTTSFMSRKKGVEGFDQSEPAFLVSCLDRHRDWAVVVCLVGSGQEINTGEAGISEWLTAIRKRFDDWSVYLSPRLREIEYNAEDELHALENNPRVRWDEALHLAASMRSFRSERVSEFVNCLLALEIGAAREALSEILPNFPIRLTRSLSAAKAWLRQRARGSERYGIVVSSQAQRLKPHAIDVRVKVDPVRWFLENKSDVRSSYYLEDVATEFQIQGLELDWTCVVWDGDLRHNAGQWDYFGFKGNRWEHVRKDIRQRYLLNAYRVLLTRARQGMVIVVPEGSDEDPSRAPSFYDPAYRLLSEVGVPAL
ncbi:DUF2075 domain-containing protein [Oleiagrimonas sp.]|uniref:DUF2075 domain-containing protein n=1 Tax=Oleiagrimonas sp. TaxID=2010330 RepID=UPI0026364753|nr:DUF2075 domain-containing protein [Oleiagrimonas sp.]MDA3915292.1 DUF2075 domain-containing protein [Oleiagrimonas sp.]